MYSDAKMNLVNQISKEIEQVYGIPKTDANMLGLQTRLLAILDDSIGLRDTIQNKQVTILLSDLRGFTAIAEKQSPLAVIEVLNRYFHRMSQIIMDYGGTIDKFMGDAIMVLFGAPTHASDDVERAIACAAEMQQAMNEINQENQQYDFPELYMGIGINTGQVVAGRLGSNIHSEYTVIGDEVNLASRVEAQSLRGQVLLSENTYQCAKNFIEIGDINEVHVKGKSTPVRMYELLATSLPRPIKVPIREVRRSPRVEVDLPVEFQKVSGKQIMPEQFLGRIVDLSYGGMLLISPIELPLHAEIRFPFAISILGNIASDCYAKVLRSNLFNDQFECSMEFSHIDKPAYHGLKNIVDSIVAEL